MAVDSNVLIEVRVDGRWVWEAHGVTQATPASCVMKALESCAEELGLPVPDDVTDEDTLAALAIYDIEPDWPPATMPLATLKHLLDELDPELAASSDLSAPHAAKFRTYECSGDVAIVRAAMEGLLALPDEDRRALVWWGY